MTVGYYSEFYKNVITQHLHGDLESLEIVKNALEERVQDMQLPFENSENIKKVPIYRCMVVLGHEFQCYPPEVAKIIKPSKQKIGDTNIVKWIL